MGRTVGRNGWLMLAACGAWLAGAWATEAGAVKTHEFKRFERPKSGGGGGRPACSPKGKPPDIVACAGCVLSGATSIKQCGTCLVSYWDSFRRSQELANVLTSMTCSDYLRCTLLGYNTEKIDQLMQCPVFKYHKECCSPGSQDRCGTFDTRNGGKFDYCNYQRSPAFQEHQKCRAQRRTNEGRGFTRTSVKLPPICSVYNTNRAPTCGGNLPSWKGPKSVRQASGRVNLRGQWLSIGTVKELATCSRNRIFRGAATLVLRVLAKKPRPKPKPSLRWGKKGTGGKGRLLKKRACATDGRRVQAPGGSAIYLVLGGQKRHIPNPRVYNDLFRSWGGIHRAACVASIPLGPPLGRNARLCVVGKGVFFDDGQRKRHVASPAVMDRFHLAWNKVRRPCVSRRTGRQIR